MTFKKSHTMLFGLALSCLPLKASYFPDDVVTIRTQHVTVEVKHFQYVEVTTPTHILRSREVSMVLTPFIPTAHRTFFQVASSVSPAMIADSMNVCIGPVLSIEPPHVREAVRKVVPWLALFHEDSKSEER